MPSINLTSDQLQMLSDTLTVALEADQQLGLLAADGVYAYEGMSGAARREVHELLRLVDAVAKEHA